MANKVFWILANVARTNRLEKFTLDISTSRAPFVKQTMRFLTPLKSMLSLEFPWSIPHHPHVAKNLVAGMPSLRDGNLER